MRRRALRRQLTAKRLLRWALIGIAIALAAVLALGNNVGYAKPAHAASVRTITVVEHAITTPGSRPAAAPT